MFISNKTVDLKIDIIVIGLLILCSKIFNSQYIMYIIFLYLCYRIVTNRYEYFFYIGLVLIPNLGILFMPGIPVPIINILPFLSILLWLVRSNKTQLNKDLMIFSVIIIMYEWLHSILYDISSIMGLITWSAMMIYIAIFISNSNIKTSYEHGIAIRCFISGVIISSIYGMYSRYLLKGNLIHIFSQGNATDRFIGAAGDPNYYSMYVLIAAFCLLNLIDKKQSNLQKIIFSILFIILILMGFMSLSRMYILTTMSLMIIYIIIITFSRRSSQQRKFILITLIIIIPVILCLGEGIINNVNIIFSRILENLDNPTLLLSNRDILIKQYIQYLSENPIALILGVGIQKYYIRAGSSYAHNVFIEMIVSMGIIGATLMVVYYKNIYNNEKKFNKNYNQAEFEKIVPLIALLICFISINAIEVESFYILIIFTIKNVLFNTDKLEEKQKDNKVMKGIVK